MKLNNRGFTLVEILIGSAVMVTLMGSIAAIRVGIGKTGADVTSRRDSYRVVESVLADLIRDDRYILPQEDPFLPTTDADHPDNWFFNKDRSVIRCLDRAGIDIPGYVFTTASANPTHSADPLLNTACPYLVSYYKIAQVDRSIANIGMAMSASDPKKAQNLTFSKIPMNRYRLRIRIPTRSESDGHALDPSKDFEIMELSRLVTNALPF